MKAKQFTSWSWSRYIEYCQCPLKAKLNHLDKIREPTNDAMLRGAKIHDQIRDYIKGFLKKLPVEFKALKVELDRWKKMFKAKTHAAVVEEDWVFTYTWGRTVWNDWDNAVLRVKLDAAEWADEGRTLLIRDWKTGKFRKEEVDTYLQQLELYALAAFKWHPQIEKVGVQLDYVDLGITYPPKPKMFTRKDDAARLEKEWAKRTKPMLNDKKFAPRPSDKCRWCFYGQAGKAKGGPGLCKF